MDFTKYKPKPRPKLIHSSVSIEVYEMLQALAAQHGVTRSVVLAAILEAFLESQKLQGNEKQER